MKLHGIFLGYIVSSSCLCKMQNDISFAYYILFQLHWHYVHYRDLPPHWFTYIRTSAGTKALYTYLHCSTAHLSEGYLSVIVLVHFLDHGLESNVGLWLSQLFHHQFEFHQVNEIARVSVISTHTQRIESSLHKCFSPVWGEANSQQGPHVVQHTTHLVIEILHRFTDG